MIPARPVFAGLLALTALLGGCGQAIGTARTNLGAGAQAQATKLKAAPANYYAAVAGLKGRDLLEGLNRIVAKHKDLGYDGARDVMFATVDDLDNDNVVSCIYIARELANVTNRSTAYRGGAGMNAEHTWPQSKGAEGVAKADLHHLFPADCKANSVRGNFPFGEVKSPDWEEGGSVRGNNAQGQLVFQPRADHRGDTARALMYFYTVYGLNGGVSLENFQVEQAVLTKWSAEDPVTEDERKRNDAVMAAQGNRNPFVDEPAFVGAVGNFLAGRK